MRSGTPFGQVAPMLGLVALEASKISLPCTGEVALCTFVASVNDRKYFTVGRGFEKIVGFDGRMLRGC